MLDYIHIYYVICGYLCLDLIPGSYPIPFHSMSYNTYVAKPECTL